MRRISMMAGLSLAVAVLAGCPPTYPNCKSDEHCQEKGEVCFNGTCQECATDTHCKEGFTCQANKCVPKGPECTQDSQCRDGICEANKCVPPECSGDTGCSGLAECQKGRCVTPPGACAADTDCGEGMVCESRRCADPMARCSWEPLRFGFNEASLTPEAQGQLRQLVNCLKRVSSTIELAGHADERGTEEYNLQLSQKRAASVKKYLQDLGVEARRLKTVGYGENRPLDPSSSEDAWSANRRVEFVR
jgi:peptidoglycan-associated lipoprotein